MSGVKGQGKGNQNARRVKYPRLVVSFSGDDLKRIYAKLAFQGEMSPTQERARKFIKEQVAGELPQEQLLTLVDEAIEVLDSKAMIYDIQQWLIERKGVYEPIERIKEASDILIETEE